MGDSIKLPEHPFIEADSTEGTLISITVVLAYMHLSLLGEIEVRQHSHLNNTDHLSGQIRILEGLQDAVKYVGDLDAARCNVTKLGEVS